MSEKLVGKDEVLGLLSEVVAEKGEDYVYKDHFLSCVNFVDGIHPACVAGHVYHKLGLTSEDVGQGTVTDAVLQMVMKGAVERVQFTVEGALVLSVAQAVQDNGGTWGLAEKVAAHMASLVTYDFEVNYTDRPIGRYPQLNVHG